MKFGRYLQGIKMGLFDRFKKKEIEERWNPPASDECGWIPVRPEEYVETLPIHNFISNENLLPNDIFGDVSQFMLKKGYVSGSMTGSVYVNNTLVQTFISTMDLKQSSCIRFTNVGEVVAVKNRTIEDEFIPSMDQTIGTAKARCSDEGSYIRDDILILKWNDYVIDNHYIVVSYEVENKGDI